jgi:large subunit ribosomal protein L5
MKKATKQQPPLKRQYLDEVVPALKKTHGYTNIHQVPRVEKIVINSRINSEASKAEIEDLGQEIAKVAGQKPVVVRSTKSISNFKLRKGVPNAFKVTLRGDGMYHFLHLFASIALPVIRDFRGLPVRFDGRGNYTVGISDHTIFPQVSIDGARKNIGMDITIVTTAQTDQEAKDLLAQLGLPFRQSSAKVAAAA